MRRFHRRELQALLRRGSAGVHLLASLDLDRIVSQQRMDRMSPGASLRSYSHQLADGMDRLDSLDQ